MQLYGRRFSQPELVGIRIVGKRLTRSIRHCPAHFRSQISATFRSTLEETSFRLAGTCSNTCARSATTVENSWSSTALNRAAACAWTGLRRRNPDPVEIKDNAELICFRITLTSDATNLDDFFRTHIIRSYVSTHGAKMDRNCQAATEGCLRSFFQTTSTNLSGENITIQLSKKRTKMRFATFQHKKRESANTEVKSWFPVRRK